MSDETGKRVIRLRPILSRSAGADLTRILIEFDDFDPDLADRFEERLDTALENVCERVATEIAESERPFDAPDETASLHWAQPVYRLKVETMKKRSRRSSAVLWYVYYSLHDSMSNGVVDTLRVRAIRHSAARPLSLESTESQDPEAI